MVKGTMTSVQLSVHCYPMAQVSLWRKNGIIAAATLSAATVVVALISLAIQVSVETRTAADFLPADATLVLTQNPTVAHLERLTAWFPSLREADSKANTIALVRLPNGNVRLLHFYRDTATVSDRATRQFPPFTVSASDEAALGVVIPSNERVSKSLRTLSPFRSCDADEPCTFFRVGELPETTDETEMFVRTVLLQDAPYATLGGERSWHLDVPSKIALPFGGPPTVTRYLPEGFLFYGRQFDKAWASLLTKLPSPRNQLFQARTEQTTAEMIGPALSFQFDLLPLLRRDGVLELRQDASGALLFAVQGTLSDNQEISDRLDRFHAFARAGAPPLQVERRLFDEQFTYENLRLAETEEFEPIHIGEWEVLQTMGTNNVMRLVTAQRAGRFIVSNDPLLLTRLGTDLDTIHTAGAAFGGRIGSDLPLWPLNGSGGLFFAQRPLRWLLTERGAYRSFRVEPE